MKPRRITIEHGIPIPPAGRPGNGIRKGHESRYPMPFSQLEVGDSFFVPIDEDEVEVRVYIRYKIASGTHRHKKAGKSFTSRMCPDGLRVWRVK